MTSSSDERADSQTRTYVRADSVVFRKTKEAFGGLSNMAGGFPLRVNGVRILTSEALYQVCRFPHLPQVQKLIVAQRSPMSAKMKSKPHRANSRPDWKRVRVRIMSWCLRVKLAQNWDAFSSLLLQTGERPIVEESLRDAFWGAKAVDEQILTGMNVLGRLLMELREEVRSRDRASLLSVEPPRISNFRLYGRQIQVVWADGMAELPKPAAQLQRPQPTPPPAVIAVQAPLFDQTSLNAETQRWRNTVQKPRVSVGDLKPYPAMKDSGVPWLGEVPEHWDLVPNRALVRLKKQIVGDAAAAYTLLSLTKSGIIPRDMENPEGKFPASFDTYQVVEPGDLIFCLFDIDETPRAVGLSSLSGMITGAYTVFACPDQQVGRFLYLLYLSLDNGKLLKPLYSGLRKVITKSRFLSAKVPLPPVTEQTAIVRYLDYIDRRVRRYIGAKQKLIALLREQKQAIIHRAVTRGLDPDVPLKPSGVEWLGEVPEHWEVARLGKLLRERAETNATGEIQDVLSVLRDRGVIPYAERGNMGNKPSEDTTRYKIVKPGDIVVNCMNVIIGSVGLSQYTGCLSPVYYVLTRRLEDDNPRYLNACFQTKPFQQSLVGIGRGILAHRMRIPMEILSRQPFPRPPGEEQTAIIEYIDTAAADLDTAMAGARRQTELLREYHTRLIADVVTGKLDVREAAANLPDEPDVTEAPQITDALGDADEETEMVEELDE